MTSYRLPIVLTVEHEELTRSLSMAIAAVVAHANENVTDTGALDSLRSRIRDVAKAWKKLNSQWLP